MSKLGKNSINDHLAFFLVVPIIVLLGSCAKAVYTPALFKNDIAYQPKPSSFDTKKSATYISGGFGNTASTSYTIGFGELNISEAHAFKQFNLSYGVYGNLGSLTNYNYSDSLHRVDPNIVKTKAFGGIGARLSANLYNNNGMVDFRYLGFEASYSNEFGDYLTYRKKINNLPGYYSFFDSQLITIGGTTEIVWRGKTIKNSINSLRLFVGQTLGNYNYFSEQDTLNQRILDFSYFPKNHLKTSLSIHKEINHLFITIEFNMLFYFSDKFRVQFGYKF